MPSFSTALSGGSGGRACVSYSIVNKHFLLQKVLVKVLQERQLVGSDCQWICRTWHLQKRGIIPSSFLRMLQLREGNLLAQGHMTQQGHGVEHSECKGESSQFQSCMLESSTQTKTDPFILSRHFGVCVSVYSLIPLGSPNGKNRLEEASEQEGESKVGGSLPPESSVLPRSGLSRSAQHLNMSQKASRAAGAHRFLSLTSPMLDT